MHAPRVSFEFFPPKSLDASFRLWDTVHTLAPLAPRFVSVTYGAGGTTRTLTREAVSTLHSATGLNVAAHLTCVNASKAETMAIADEFHASGVREIVALRGDAPKDSGGFKPHPDGFKDSCELIEALKDRGDFTIRVGAYPEAHPEAADADADVAYLKRKFEAGADEAITQFFFDADTFLRFRDRCAAAGIDKPIIPGIFPIENWSSARRFAESCGTTVPKWLNSAFETAERDDRTDLLAIAHATEMCSKLMEDGVRDLHFYTLNRPELTRDICHALGITPKVELRDVA
jgi:methylenetetrahydrofolate reductase (NADPH)